MFLAPAATRVLNRGGLGLYSPLDRARKAMSVETWGDYTDRPISPRARKETCQMQRESL